MFFWEHGATRSRHTPFNTADIEQLKDALVPDVEIMSTLGSELLLEDRVIRRLTMEQYSLLSALSELRRVAVRGGAGTGKTMLAAEKARRLALEGNRTLLTCFNRSLGRSFQRMEKPPNLVATNFHDLCWALAEEAGCEIPPRTQDSAPS